MQIIIGEKKMRSDHDVEDCMLIYNVYKSKYFIDFENVAWLCCIKT